MKAVRALLAIAMFAVAALAAHRLSWTRYTCDIEKRSADRRLYRVFRSGTEAERSAVGRTTLARLRPCLERDPFDYQLRVSYGMAADAAGQKVLAMAMYRSALALNERPEILANLAEVQLEMGQPDEANRNLVRACSFHIAYARKVGEPMRSEIIAQVKARAERLSSAAKRPQDQPQVTHERP